VNYIVCRGLNDNLPAPNNQTYLAMIPVVAQLDLRWGKVNANNFIPNRYPAHGDFANTVKNFLGSKTLIKQMIDARRDLDTESEEVEDAITKKDATVLTSARRSTSPKNTQIESQQIVDKP